MKKLIMLFMATTMLVACEQNTAKSNPQAAIVVSRGVCYEVKFYDNVSSKCYSMLEAHNAANSLNSYVRSTVKRGIAK